MTIELLKHLLLYILIFNLCTVTIWFGVFSCAHDRLFLLHSRWFQITANQFDVIHYTGMMLYKLAIYFLNVGPLVALWFAT